MQNSSHASRTIRRFLPDNIPHIATRGYLLLPSPRIQEYSDIWIVFPPQYLLYHPPAPFLENSITIVADVIVWGCLVHVTVPSSTSGSTGCLRKWQPALQILQDESKLVNILIK